MWDNEKEHRYEDFLKAVSNRFDELVREYGKLFTTDAEGLWDIYLNNLPETLRQVYNCRACRKFVEIYGNLVFIKEDGTTVSAIWSLTPPDYFKNSISKLKATVEKARVNGVFMSDSTVLGTPRTGEWEHLSVTLPPALVNRSRIKNAIQLRAEKREEYGMLSRGLVEFPIEIMEQAMNIFQSEALYRGDKFLGNAKWLYELHGKRANVANSRAKENITWLAVATAPTGFCHVKSGMIGTVLDDIKSGYSFNVIKVRFEEKMGTYQRSQSAPSSNAIYEAEKLVQKLGIENSLQRRYATLDEVPAFWKVKAHDHASYSNTKPVGGVFGAITPKDKPKTLAELNLPLTVMTWDKFKRTVLGGADSIEVLVDNPSRLMALVTAYDATAPNILQWDNPFSWYYHGGVDGEIKARVENAGGRYEDNEIRCSLIWDGYTDLDLHCITPNGFHISYNQKRSMRCSGYLDVDANGVDGKTLTPVENIRWAENAPTGRYQFYVHNYHERTNYREGTPYKVELEINGQVYTYNGAPLRDGQKEIVFEFDYVKGQTPTIRGAQGNSSNEWNLPDGQFVKVNAITTSPNLWNGEQFAHLGNHTFFILDGCRDLSEGKGRGFFNEMLQPELRQIRKTLEAYTASTPINGLDEATACGVGFSKDIEWNVTLKVRTGNSTRLIKIDRFD